jgi:predicted RND superfamily exporter protein
MRRATVARIVNQSLWETVRRSLATTFITLLPVSALFFFGGDTLKDFAFAILIGISISAFSTIFIAAPFLAVLLERSPDYKHRKDVVEGVGKDDELVEEVEVVAEPTPVPEEVAAPVAQEDGKRAVPATTTTDTAARERRRQRRRAKPHGRPR